MSYRVRRWWDDLRFDYTRQPIFGALYPFDDRRHQWRTEAAMRREHRRFRHRTRNQVRDRAGTDR